MERWQYKKLENAYYHAKERCNNPEHPRYTDWGGRGIQFRFSKLTDFISVIGIPEERSWVLDRINNDGNYEVGNLRWTTASESSRNKRIAKNNTSGVKGVSRRKNGDWSAQCWVNGKQVHLYQGCSFEEAVKARKEWESCVGPNMLELEEIKF